jgi:hypothetical protein
LSSGIVFFSTDSGAICLALFQKFQPPIHDLMPASALTGGFSIDVLKAAMGGPIDGNAGKTLRAFILRFCGD